ncbi:PP2C family protein-serine/threonine phosphatase [Sagittula salina]|uniref:Serine/threonine-protein phosphatase n=1 Tax=Sagittula salina TaxID=2820268 RepID=A0A940MW15_9RHOB|nr:protein phosphatase 2C domain-containing protein [Sagittula salina]MBP0484977.1 serine/threonine-protein phosphatase [Sagittula salina]
MDHNEFFTFETGQATDVGCKRTVNEDNFLSRPDCGLWVVSDGMGGHAAGDYASYTIVQALNSIGMSGSPDDLQARFMERIHRANHDIYEHALKMQRGTIGATLVALLVHGEDYACIWSGDSRIYLLRDGQLVQQTRDHTELRMLLDSGAITAEEAENWPRKNVITRAIGVTEEPHCDVISGKLALDDTFILCSDGLTEHLSDADIADHARSYAPKEACERMIRLTLERGAKDNVTVVAMRCLPPPELEEEDDLMDDVLELDQTNGEDRA